MKDLARPEGPGSSLKWIREQIGSVMALIRKGFEMKSDEPVFLLRPEQRTNFS
jgi:hypothetical protein